MESMQDLESDDLDCTHDSISFYVTLDKLLKFQEHPIPGSGCAMEMIVVIFPYSVVVLYINPLPGSIYYTT